MMWNFLASSLLKEVVPVLYDGSLMYPEPDSLWRMYEETQATVIGANPGYITLLQKAGMVPKDKFKLPHLRCAMLAGSPVTPEVMEWFYQNVKSNMMVQNGSGGTDICSGFIGGVPILPVRAGEMQAPLLGVGHRRLRHAGPQRRQRSGRDGAHQAAALHAGIPLGR